MATKIICDACGADIPEKGPHTVNITIPGRELQVTAQVLPEITTYRRVHVETGTSHDICARCIADAFMLLSQKHDEMVKVKR